MAAQKAIAREGTSMRSDDSMNAEEVARYLQIGKNSVYQLAKSGQLASYHIGRKLRFSLADVDAYVASTRSRASYELDQAALSPAAPQSVFVDASAHESTQFVADALGAAPGKEPFVIAGNDISGDVFANYLVSAGIPIARTYRGSYVGLVNLYAGTADAAIAHLYDLKTNSYNVPYVQRLAPGKSVVVVRLYQRRQGFVVAPDNPKRLTTWGSLLRSGVRLANRELGCGSRILLDEKLTALEARGETIEGYTDEYASGLLAASRVAAGAADVAVVTEAVARRMQGVQFVPMQAEWVDLVIAKSERTRPLVRRLKQLAADERFQVEFARLAGADTSSMGVIIYES